MFLLFDAARYDLISFKDCFSRGLLKEALGQLAGLKRRKLALEMLGAAVQTGLNHKKALNSRIEQGRKRQRSSDEPPKDAEGVIEEGASSKKARIDA